MNTFPWKIRPTLFYATTLKVSVASVTEPASLYVSPAEEERVAF